MLLIQFMLALALAPQTAEGALTLVTEPGARVVWDGVELGQTDSQGRIHISGIPLGSYQVAFFKEGFEPSRRRIEVEAGHSALSFELTASPPPRASLKATAPEPPPPVAKVSEPPRTAAVALDLPRGRAREVRASQITEAQHFDVSWLWFVPLAGLLGGVLFWLGRVQRAGPAAAAGANFPGPGFPRPPDFAREDAARVGSSSVSFLDDLRRREAMAEWGVDVPRGEDAEAAIDLGEDDVRSLEEPRNSSGSPSGQGDGS